MGPDTTLSFWTLRSDFRKGVVNKIDDEISHITLFFSTTVPRPSELTLVVVTVGEVWETMVR